MAKRILVLGCHSFENSLAEELAKNAKELAKNGDVIIIQNQDEKINELIDLFSLEKDNNDRIVLNEDYILRENKPSKYFTKPKNNFKKK